MKSFSVSICLSALFSLGFGVQHETSRSDVFDTLADIMEDGLPTNFLEDFSMSNLAAKVPFLQQQQQYPGSTTSGGPVQYIQNLAPLGLGQFLSGIFGSTPSTTSPGRPGVSTQYPVYPSDGNTNLMSALTSIARYDDLKCVPRLLCEVAAGGRPGEKQQFGGRNTILSLLSLIGGEMTSPVVVFGRAMLLGLTVQGDPGTCYSAYPSCPRDPDRLVDYLNNHRGGLFRFFSATGLPAYYTQQYSQARIQTPYQRLPMPQTDLRPPRVTINTDKGHRHFLPQRKVLTHKTLPPLSSRPSSEFQRPLTFPGDRGRLYTAQPGEGSAVEDTLRREQHFAFPDRARTESSREEASTESYPSPINPNIHRLPPPVAVQLPDRTGTGELRIDNDESTFGPSSFSSRYRRDVVGSKSLNVLKQRMVFPQNDEHQSKDTRKMRFPSDIDDESMNFSLDSESTRDGYQKLNKQNSLNEHPVWDKPRVVVTRELFKFPEPTNERENRQELKRHLMKFPSDNNHDGNDSKVSFTSETSKNKKSTRSMKFPVEYSGHSDKTESNQILTKDYNSASKVTFQDVQESFRKTPSYGFVFPQNESKETSNVANTALNLETSINKKNTRRMKFPVEYSDHSEKSESNHILTKGHSSVSKVKFQNVQEDFRGTPSYESIFPHTVSKESANVAKILFKLETPKDQKSTRRMKFPVEYSDQNVKSVSNQVITKGNNDIFKVRFQNVAEVYEKTPSYGITFPQNRAKDSSNVKFLETPGS